VEAQYYARKSKSRSTSPHKYFIKYFCAQPRGHHNSSQNAQSNEQAAEIKRRENTLHPSYQKRNVGRPLGQNIHAGIKQTSDS
jgi:hypothetical protein